MATEAAARSPGSPELLERRRRILDLSGWGRPFRFFQPHNLCFWVFSAITLVGIFHLIDYFSRGGRGAGTAIGAGVAATVVYGLIFIAFLRTTDHYERQPRKLVITAFIWGGTAACFAMAIKGNDALLGIYPKLFGQAFSADWGAALAAPFTEETAKASGFILLLGLAPRLIRSPYDGVFIGAFIGLGFQLVEDVTYSLSSALSAFGVEQAHVALATFAVRAASGVFSHTLFTALFCCGLIYAIGTPVQPRRLGLGIGLIALAMLTHGVWDGAVAIGDGSPASLLIGVALGIVALVAVIAALRRTAPQEREFLRGILEPEVANGTITRAELDAACAPRRERRRAARAGKGRGAHHAAKHVLRATFDLAHEIAAAGGEDSDGVRHERAEIARLRAAT